MRESEQWLTKVEICSASMTPIRTSIVNCCVVVFTSRLGSMVVMVSAVVSESGSPSANEAPVNLRFSLHNVSLERGRAFTNISSFECAPASRSYSSRDPRLHFTLTSAVGLETASYIASTTFIRRSPIDSPKCRPISRFRSYTSSLLELSLVFLRSWSCTRSMWSRQECRDFLHTIQGS